MKEKKKKKLIERKKIFFYQTAMKMLLIWEVYKNKKGYILGVGKREVWYAS